MGCVCSQAKPIVNSEMMKNPECSHADNNKKNVSGDGNISTNIKSLNRECSNEKFEEDQSENPDDNHLIKLKVDKGIPQTKSLPGNNLLKLSTDKMNNFPAIPSFNELSAVKVDKVEKPSKTYDKKKFLDGNKLFSINNNGFYVDFFTRQKVDFSLKGLSNRKNSATNKLSISNSSLSFDHTPSFSEDSNCKGVVNVTNITTININLGKNVSNTHVGSSPKSSIHTHAP